MMNIKPLAYLVLLTFAAAADAADPAPAAVSAASPEMALTVFQARLQGAVNKERYYPREAILDNEQGTVEVEFDYTGDGKATNIKLGSITASNRLNQATLRAVEHATLPPKPPELAAITHFHIRMTYTLGR